MIDPSTRGFARFAQIVVIAILVGIGINHIVFAIRDWPLGDMDVYLAAAQRLRDGEPLYVAGDVGIDSYWYAPWFAIAWIPMTYLPREVVAVIWSAVLIGATAAVCVILGREGRQGVLVALLVGPPLFAVSAGGNIQAIMVLTLLVGFFRRWGPVAVAAAASLKLTPILLAAAYAARREWMRAAVAAVLAVLLYAPALLMGLMDAEIRSQAAPSILGISPVLYVVVVLGALVATFLVPRRFALLAAATASVLALPRLFVYDATTIAVGAAKEPDAEAQGG